MPNIPAKNLPKDVKLQDDLGCVVFDPNTSIGYQRPLSDLKEFVRSNALSVNMILENPTWTKIGGEAGSPTITLNPSNNLRTIAITDPNKNKISLEYKEATLEGNFIDGREVFARFFGWIQMQAEVSSTILIERFFQVKRAGQTDYGSRIKTSEHLESFSGNEIKSIVMNCFDWVTKYDQALYSPGDDVKIFFDLSLNNARSSLGDDLNGRAGTIKVIFGASILQLFQYNQS